MPRSAFRPRLAAVLLPLLLSGCGLAADGDPGYRQPVTNASNGQPEPPGSLPRGAAVYGSPPAMGSISAGSGARVVR